MRKILAVFLTVCLLTSSPAAWADYWNEGNNGTTEDDAYLIDSIDDLKALRNRVNAGTEPDDRYYRLEIDMNLTEMTYWEPIGTSSGGHYFKGHFNGNGKSIHVNISSYNSNRGLFGYVKTEADTYAVKNLTVNGKVAGRGAADIVFNLYSGIIDNCTFTGTLSRYCYNAYNSDVGGIVWHMAGGKITKCTVNATITDLRGNDYGGGIVGIMNAGTVKDNSAYITLSETASHIGT